MSSSLVYPACIKGSPFRHCFISFPHHWRAFIAPASIPTFLLESSHHSLVASWAGHTHDQEIGEDDTIFLSSKFLIANEIVEGESVIVRQLTCFSPCSIAVMSVHSSSDWEELLLNTDIIQNKLLTQFRVLKIGQTLPLWLEGGSVVNLKVCKFSPSSPVGLLQLDSQVEILPPPKDDSIHPLTISPCMDEKKGNSLKPTLDYKTIWKIVYSIFILFGYGQRKINIPPKEEVLLKLKVLPFRCDEHQQSLFSKFLLSHPSIILVSKDNLKGTKHEYSKYFIATVYKVKSRESPSDEPDEPPSNNLALTLVWESVRSLFGLNSFLTSNLDLMLKYRTCIVCHSLRRKLMLEAIDAIVIESINVSSKNESFQIDMFVDNAVSIDKKTINCAVLSIFTDLSRICPIIVNDSSSIKLMYNSQELKILMSLRSHDPIIIEPVSLPHLSLHIDYESVQRRNEEQESNSVLNDIPSNISINKKVLDLICEVICKHYSLDYHLRFKPQFMLLEGDKGSGKTYLLDNLISKLSGMPYFLHCKIIHFKHLVGKKVDSVQKLMKSSIKEVFDFRPSLLILDDLDIIAPSHSSEEETKGSLYEYNTEMAYMMKIVLKQLSETIFHYDHSLFHPRACVFVIATSCSKKDLHPFLSSVQGSYIFSKVFKILPMSPDEKLEALESLIHQKYEIFISNYHTINDLDTQNSIFQYDKDDILKYLEGLNLSDITKLAQRIFLEAKLRWFVESESVENFSTVMNSPCCYDFCIEEVDVEKARKGFASLTQRGLPHKTSKPNHEVGGLHKAKQALEEMIIWPSQYPQLFAQTKLKLRTGILLYGPPGCGKTLLAKSFEGVSYLNFISVKGPELLSKYIGQSEKAVRDAFAKAKNAKPCVLFFDEFDSISPRRGHDSTGVTDRVVNQLLTEIDGVEGLSGVYIIGATSRPELIDPALLRPGRLDKAIYCPMPDESEREEILKAISKELSFEDDVDLSIIAKRTEGFTGADLQSIFTTAQIKAAEEVLGSTLYQGVLPESYYKSTSGEPSPESSNKNTTKKDLRLSVKLLEDALKEVRPSVSYQERRRFEKVYEKFSSKKKSITFSEVKAGKRETLA